MLNIGLFPHLKVLSKGSCGLSDDPQKNSIYSQDYSSKSPLHTNSGCGKRQAHINWSMVTCKMAAPVTGTTLRTTGPVPADSRQ